MSTNEWSAHRHADLDVRLDAIYSVAVPVAIATEVDRRVRTAVSAEALIRHRRAATAGRRTRRRTIGALAVAAVLVAAGAMPLFRFFDGWGQSFDRVFELSTPIDQSVTRDGYRVSIVRAYADSESVRLAITAEDLEDRGWAEINIAGVSITDDVGRTYPAEVMAAQQPSRTSSESWSRFRVPEDSTEDRERRLSVDVIGIAVRGATQPTLADGEVDLDRIWTTVDGTWSFAFDLPFILAHSARPGIVATVAGVTVNLEEISVTPAETVGQLSFLGLPERDPDWAWDPYFHVEHDGQRLTVSAMQPGFVTTSLLFRADPGYVNLEGLWVVTIDEFHRTIPDPNSDITTEEESIRGPWVLTWHGVKPATP